MKANELRIGNCLYIDWLDEDTGKWHQNEHEITYRDLWNLENGHELVKKSYEPIPLTEEWKRKLGLESSDPILMYNSDGDAVYLSDFEHIEFVHQLQNLVFAIESRELTLTP
jgi:hypothetical protein